MVRQNCDYMASCFSPIQIENPKFNGQDKMLNVRCGKCENCLKTLINDWAFRLEFEAKAHIYVHFITLTYDPKFVPLSKNLLPTLHQVDLQKFWKRLRKRNGKLKYFVVGEYGTKTARPHYHAIVYGVKDVDFYFKSWYQGNVHVGDDFSGAAVRYTLKYMYKKGMIPAFEDDDRVPEFRMMSKKLGLSYMSEEKYKWHYEDLERLNYVVNNQGIKQTLPRYYRKRLLYYLDEDKLKELLPEIEQVQIDYQRKNQLLRRFEIDKKQNERVKV